VTIPQTYHSKPLIHKWVYPNQVCLVARYDDGKKKEIVPFTRNGSGWRMGAPEEPRMLYGLDQIKQDGSFCVVAEGEKCTEAVLSLGINAVTSLGGSNAPSKTNWEPISGGPVYLLPDNDEPGRKYAKEVAGILADINPQIELYIVNLPGLPPKGDAVEWIQTRIPGWDGISPIPEQHREWLQAEFMQAVEEHKSPVPEEWLTSMPVIEWREPGRIESRLRPVTQLPTKLIPEPYRGWISDITHRMQTPLDFAAISAIVVTGSVIGTGCAIRPKQKDNWEVMPNLWGVCIGPPSAMKSPSMKEPMDMLSRLQAEAHEAYQQELMDYQFDKQVREAQRKQLEKDIQKAATAKVPDPAKLDALRNDFRMLEEGEEPAPRMFKTNETSIQSQTVLQKQNPRGLLVFRDELTGWLSRLDKPEYGDERAYYLEGWNGNGSYTDFKIGRGLTDAPNICISVLGGTQPDKAKRYIRQSMTGGNDGLVQRLQMAVYPDESKDWRLVDTYPNTAEKNRVYEIMHTLAYADFTQWGGIKGEHDKFPYMRFTEGGQSVFNDWLTELQTDKLPNEDNPLMAEHLSKYRSLMPSLALIIHLIGMADGTAQGQVSEHAAKLAAGWCEYLESHARRIYGMVATPEHEAASILAERIKAGKLPNPFTVKDVYRKHWAGLSDRAIIEAACMILIDEDWVVIERARASRPKGGRPPLPKFWINPVLGVVKA